MYALDNQPPPCADCGHGDIPLDEAHVEAVRVWALLNTHARSGLDGTMRLEAMRAECDRSADPVGLFEKILLLEDVFRRRAE